MVVLRFKASHSQLLIRAYDDYDGKGGVEMGEGASCLVTLRDAKI